MKPKIIKQESLLCILKNTTSLNLFQECGDVRVKEISSKICLKFDKSINFDFFLQRSLVNKIIISQVLNIIYKMIISQVLIIVYKMIISRVLDKCTFPVVDLTSLSIVDGEEGSVTRPNWLSSLPLSLMKEFSNI